MLAIIRVFTDIIPFSDTKAGVIREIEVSSYPI